MTATILDTTVFEELAKAIGDEFAAALLTTFLGDADSMFAELRRSVTEEDADGYRRAAHSIKSNAQTFGATELAAQARELEMSGTMDAAAVDGLRTTLDATASALKGLIDG